MKTDKNNLDVSQIFLTFMSLVGDVEKTALALDLDVAVVEELAKKEGWDEKVRRISVMSKSGNPGDYERAVNRALNYVQAHRMRSALESVLNQVLKRLGEADPSDFVEIKLKEGKVVEARVTARFFSDMAAAMEKMQHLTYSALGDSATERKVDTQTPGSGRQVDIHSAVINALNRASISEQIPPEVLRATSAIPAAPLDAQLTNG